MRNTCIGQTFDSSGINCSSQQRPGKKPDCPPCTPVSCSSLSRYHSESTRSCPGSSFLRTQTIGQGACQKTCGICLYMRTCEQCRSGYGEYYCSNSHGYYSVDTYTIAASGSCREKTCRRCEKTCRAYPCVQHRTDKLNDYTDFSFENCCVSDSNPPPVYTPPPPPSSSIYTPPPEDEDDVDVCVGQMTCPSGYEHRSSCRSGYYEAHKQIVGIVGNSRCPQKTCVKCTPTCEIYSCPEEHTKQNLSSTDFTETKCCYKIPPTPTTLPPPRPTCDTETNGCRRCGTSRTEKRSNYSTLEGSAATCWACCQPPTTRARTCTYPHNFNYCGNYGMIPKNPLPNTGPRTKENCCQPAPTCADTSANPGAQPYECGCGISTVLLKGLECPFIAKHTLKSNASRITSISKSNCCNPPPPFKLCLCAGRDCGYNPYVCWDGVVVIGSAEPDSLGAKKCRDKGLPGLAGRCTIEP